MTVADSQQPARATSRTFLIVISGKTSGPFRNYNICLQIENTKKLVDAIEFG